MEVVIYQKQKEVKKDVEKLFVSAFPEEERPPVDIYFASFVKSNHRLFAFYEEEKFIGFSSIILYKNIAYIFFLAITPKYRHQGYGSKILDYIKKNYKDYVLLLCYEEVDTKYKDYELRKFRQAFYTKNGFLPNGLKTNEYGVIFETAYIGAHQVSFTDYIEIFVTGFGEYARKYITEVIS